MIKRIASTLAVTAFAAGLSTSVMAQSIQLGPDGVRVVPPGQERSERVIEEYDEVTPREASRIAREAGVAEVDDVVTRRNSYRVVGVDRRGRDIEVDVSRSTGEILDVNRI